MRYGAFSSDAAGMWPRRSPHPPISRFGSFRCLWTHSGPCSALEGAFAHLWYRPRSRLRCRSEIAIAFDEFRHPATAQHVLEHRICRVAGALAIRVVGIAASLMRRPSGSATASITGESARVRHRLGVGSIGPQSASSSRPWARKALIVLIDCGVSYIPSLARRARPGTRWSRLAMRRPPSADLGRRSRFP